MTPIVCALPNPKSTDDYIIISVTGSNITIRTICDDTEKSLSQDSILELSRKATIPTELSFHLLATLISKRDSGDMAIELILSLLERHSIEEVEAILDEYGDSPDSYLVPTINSGFEDDDNDVNPFESPLQDLSEYKLSDIISNEISALQAYIEQLQGLRSVNLQNLQELQKTIMQLEQRIKELKQFL